MTVIKCPITSLFFSMVIIAAAHVSADTADDENPLAAIPMRHIGPALMSGRISDFAFYPGGNQAFIAGISSGNIFRTLNGGTTWEPIFENEDSYAIGVVEIDPNDSNTIWVGTGEGNPRNSQSAGFGVYKSVWWLGLSLTSSIALRPSSNQILLMALAKSKNVLLSFN